MTVPVVIAAKHLHIPAILHESDMTPGLANRLAIPAAKKVCCNFPETTDHLPPEKAVLTGSPIRQELLRGNADKAMEFCGFSSRKPVILVMGGSLGAASINENIRKILPDLLADFHIIHLCGKDKSDPSLEHTEGYVQFEYIKDELADFFALADLVVSRAGANAICEILALQKPNLLIPLSARASRGDQILNARSFERQNFSMVLEEDDITEKALLSAIRELYCHRETFCNAMKKNNSIDAITRITDLFEEITSSHSS